MRILASSVVDGFLDAGDGLGIFGIILGKDSVSRPVLFFLRR
jgi:hypothetical protein